MVNTCCVCGKEANPNENRTFHCFPKNADLKQKWFEAIGKIVSYSSARICSDHFSKNDFNHDTTKRKRLLSIAIPNKENRNSLTDREINEQINDYEDENCLNQNTNTVIRKRKISNVQMDICNENVPHKKIYLNLPNNKVATLTRSNFTSDEAWNTFVRSTIYSRKKNKYLMETCQRFRKKICNLESLLKSLGNKRLLTNSSIDAIKKVNLAAQVLSNSVSDALLHAEVDRKLIKTDSEFNFKGASATAKFCKTFNDIFDLLNSRNLYNKTELKCAITKTNINILKSKVENYIKYIANLKINDVPILQTNVRTGFIGFTICLQNVITLAEQLLSEDKITFFLTYKLSQDHVETFFALIRRMGGWNNNPSVRLFKASYRKILQLAKVSVPLSANCVPKDDTTLLSLSENYSETGDKCTKNENIDADSDNLFQNVLLDHDYFMSSNYNPSEYARDIIKYVAGFVIRNIERKLSCQTCCDKLRNKNTYSEDVSKLLLRKNHMTNVDLQNRRGLIEASSDVINICEVAEKILRHNRSILFSKKNIIEYLICQCFRFMPTKIFVDDSHMLDQSPLFDHRRQVIKLILKKFLEVRLHYPHGT